jgi:hypothetical protein
VRDEKAFFRPWVKHSWHRQILGRNDIHAPPVQSAALAPSREAQVPAHFDVMTKRTDSSKIGRHRKIGIVPSQYRRKPPTLNVDRLVTYLFKFFANSSDRVPASFAFGFAPELKAFTLPLGRADVREAKEVEGVGFSYSTDCSTLGRKTTKLDEPRFSGCSSNANFASRAFKLVRNINASWRCWKPTTVSSA